MILFVCFLLFLILQFLYHYYYHSIDSNCDLRIKLVNKQLLSRLYGFVRVEVQSVTTFGGINPNDTIRKIKEIEFQYYVIHLIQISTV